MLTPQDHEPSRSSTPNAPDEGTLKKPKGDIKPPSPVDLSSDDSDSDLEPDTLVPKFLELQTRLYEIQPDLFDRSRKVKSNRGESESHQNPRAMRIQRKIGNIEKDVLFDIHDAESRWREKLEDLRKEATYSRQKPQGEHPPSEQVESQEPSANIKEDSNVLSADTDNNEEQGDLLGDMFGLEEPSLEVGVITEELNAASITHRDFGKWTGLTPRRVLEETCKSRYVMPLKRIRTANAI